MSRQDTLMGLSAKAQEIILGCKLPHYGGIYESIEMMGNSCQKLNGTVSIPKLESCVKTEESENIYLGMLNSEYPLMKYTFRNGEVLEEFEQASPWSSGPVIFLALQDIHGNPLVESLWSDEEIESYA